MLNDRIARAAFLISFFGHCLFLKMPALHLSLFESKAPEEVTVKIEIEKPALMPKIEVMGEKKKLKKIEQSKQAEPESEPQSEEVAIKKLPEKSIEEEIEVIDPEQEAMLRYQDMIKQRIQQERRYPLWAKKQAIEGSVYLSFKVLTNGLTRDIEIIQSSGYEILDREAIKTIQRGEPFPTIPKEINMPSLQMRISLVFKLK